MAYENIVSIIGYLTIANIYTFINIPLVDQDVHSYHVIYQYTLKLNVTCFSESVLTHAGMEIG